MLAIERRNAILSVLREDKHVVVSELAKAFEEVQFGSINIKLKIQLLLMKYKRICALEYLVNNR